MTETGKFVFIAPSSKGVHKWMPGGRVTEKVIQGRLDAVQFSIEAGIQGSKAPRPPNATRRPSFDISQAQEEGLVEKNKDHTEGFAAYVLPGGGLAVERKFGELPNTPGLKLIRPIVFATKECMVAFNGYLSNTAEILSTYTTSRTSYQTKLGGLIRKEVQEKPAWTVTGNRATLEGEIVLRLYQHLGPEKMLPVIRGTFAFALYDSEKGRAFVVRDPSGKVPLFEGEDGEGGLVVTSDSNVFVPGCVDLEEIAPGHYLCGRRVGALQYAEPEDPSYLRRLEEARASREYEHEAQNELSAGERLNKLMSGLRYRDAPGNAPVRADGDEDRALGWKGASG